MADQRPLDEFFDPDADPTPEVEPVQATYRWVADGATCTGCGEEHRRFWVDGNYLVCPDCKEW